MSIFRRRSVASLPVESPASPEGIAFGDVVLDEAEATSHFLAVGATGSGKTCVIRRLLQSTLPAVATSDFHAIIADAKQDALPMLSAMVDPKWIRSLNPFDDRGVAWRMHEDIREYRVAIEFAFILMPAVQESQPFFSDACRHLMIGVLKNFILKGREWTLGDLIRVLMCERVLRQVLRQLPETRDLIHLYLSDPRLSANVMSTMATKLVLFEPIAACYENASGSISLAEWIREPGVLILGNSEISRTAIEAINRCVFKRASDLTLDLPESRSRRVMFVIDELANSGPLDGLVSLAKMGRSKGAVIVIAFQSVSGLRDPKKYGQHFTDELLGQFGNRFFGRLECPVTAEWASQIVGDQEVSTSSVTYSSGANGQSQSRTFQDQIRRAILPSEFMEITPCNRDNGLTGLFMVRSVGTFFETIPGDRLFDELLVPPRGDIPESVPRDARHQMLRNWSRDRAKYFDIDVSFDDPTNQLPPTDDFEDLFHDDQP